MAGVDFDVLKAAVGWLEHGHRVALATVVGTWGSAPRPVGAWLALRNDGAIVGSVSGGCIEDDLIDRMRSGQFRNSRPELLTYGVTRDEALRFGLPCGGTLRLVIEPAPEVALLSELLARVESGELVARTLDLSDGKTRLAPAPPHATLAYDDAYLTTLHGPRWRLLVVGAGQVSQYLAQMALTLDYQVTVCDPREEYTATWQVAGSRLVGDMPDDAVRESHPDRRTAIVALTHDPKLDDLAVLEALKSPAFYVGALGSRANNAKRRERLRQFDLTEAQIARLRGPVGLPIGSRTPPEIALSILAEMTAIKNGATLASAAPSTRAAA